HARGPARYKSRGVSVNLMKLLFWSIGVSAAGFALSLSGHCQARNVIVRPKEIHNILVNPGMGITTFQRFNHQAIYPGLRWSEVGPEGTVADSPTKPDFPDTSIA